jgi:AbrB family looped-hinge helix DNA binding protein
LRWIHRNHPKEMPVIEFTATISSKNQITVPAEVRRRLGIGPADKVAFVFREGGEVEFRLAKYDLESILGSLPPLPNASVDFEREIEEATAEEMERVMAKWS